MKETYQNIWVTLSDGRVGVFSGPTLVEEKDTEVGVTVADLQFSEPKDLPEGYSFASPEEEENKK